jgi:mono/diheme cytochrome c family protein
MERKMMRNWKYLGACLALCFLLMFFTRTARLSAAAAPVAKQQAKRASEHSTDSGEGERVFKQNCSRCHQAPQGFAPQISGTIVRHMRVRAYLSPNDERELLRFLNP